MFEQVEMVWSTTLLVAVHAEPVRTIRSYCNVNDTPIEGRERSSRMRLLLLLVLDDEHDGERRHPLFEIRVCS